MPSIPDQAFGFATKALHAGQRPDADRGPAKSPAQFPSTGGTQVGAASDFFRTTRLAHSRRLAPYALAPFYAVAVALFGGWARLLHKKIRIVGGTVQ